ncbi:hypothetical protein [Streptomyces sp. NPDC023838]|uniref:hypothetical protein n=1 Tax=Streptomyces sp. NPDC023838 TaxID=3154325 RepID=UPI0033D60FB0
MASTPEEAVRQARRNPHFRQTNLWLGEKSISYLAEIGMISEREHRWWRRAGLMR